MFNFRPSSSTKSTNTTIEKNATQKLFTPANQCHICDKTFANPYNVKLHIKVDHERSEVFKCSMCIQSFKFQNQLQMHISSVHPTQSRSHTCSVPLCGKTYAQISHLKLHMKMDHKPNSAAAAEIIKVFKCKHCEKVFGEGKALNIHVAKSHKNNVTIPAILTTHPFKCDICVLAFKLKSELELHKMIHHEKKSNFKCKYCQYTCTKNEEFRNHLKSHVKSNNKQKEENIQKKVPEQKVMPTKETSRKIVKTESPDIIIEDTKPKCGFCFKAFSSFASLKVHVSNIHQFNKNYKCKFCEKVFGQSGSLKDHIVNVHQLQITGYKCDYIRCEKSFSKAGDLKIHKKSAHNQLDFKVYDEPKQVDDQFSGKCLFFCHLFVHIHIFF